jgi:hypothetical protein
MSLTVDQKAKFVHAVRNHPEIGVGTCSVIDECYSDEELVTTFADKASSVTVAVEQAEQAHELWKYRMDNAENLW